MQAFAQVLGPAATHLIPAVQQLPAANAALTALAIPSAPIVKNQIRDEVKAEVLQEAKAENWAQPNALPAWINRFTWNGDFRFRDEFDLYGKNNIGSDGVDGFINYAAFNANGPTDVNPNSILNTIPFLDTTANRYNQLSLRARFGFIANVSHQFRRRVRTFAETHQSFRKCTVSVHGHVARDIVEDVGFG